MAPTDLYHLIWILLTTIVTVLIAVVGFFLKEWGSGLKENTNAVVRLTAQMELLLHEVYKIPKIENDLNKLGSKLRSYDS